MYRCYLKQIMNRWPSKKQAVKERCYIVMLQYSGKQKHSDEFFIFYFYKIVHDKLCYFILQLFTYTLIKKYIHRLFWKSSTGKKILNFMTKRHWQCMKPLKLVDNPIKLNHKYMMLHNLSQSWYSHWIFKCNHCL